MHSRQTTVASVLGLAGLGLALPTDYHKDDFTIHYTAGVASATAGAEAVIAGPIPSFTSRVTYDNAADRAVAVDNDPDHLTAHLEGGVIGGVVADIAGTTPSPTSHALAADIDPDHLTAHLEGGVKAGASAVIAVPIPSSTSRVTYDNAADQTVAADSDPDHLIVHLEGGVIGGVVVNIAETTPSSNSHVACDNVAAWDLAADDDKVTTIYGTLSGVLPEPTHSCDMPPNHDNAFDIETDSATTLKTVTAIMPPKPVIISQTFPAPPTPIVTPTISTDATPTLATTVEEREENADALHKLREGKCTGANGQCRVSVKGIPMKKDCEHSTRCSAKGSRCFMSGRSWSRYHISCL